MRAVTLNPDNAKAKELKELGAEIAQVTNMDNVAELEKAIQGAYGVFAVTNFWGMLAENPETAYDREIAQGKAIGDICKRLGMKHLVYSGLEYAKEIIGKPCPHLDILVAKELLRSIWMKLVCQTQALDTLSILIISLPFSHPRKKKMVHTLLPMLHKSPCMVCRLLTEVQRLHRSSTILMSTLGRRLDSVVKNSVEMNMQLFSAR